MLNRTMLAALLATTLIAGPATALAKPQAEIRWTRYGVPHIKAKDYEGLGFGHGYAVARDRLCLLADRMVTLRGERARWYGADAIGAVGFLPTTNINADLFHRLHLSQPSVESALAQLDPRTRDLVRGYAAGYNRYVAALPADERAKACDGAPIPEMTEVDVARNMMAIGTIWKAFQIAPFGTSSSWDAPVPAPLARATPTRLPPTIGSNAWSYGGDVTGGGAIVMANPHSRWDKGQWLMLHQVHLTIDGEIDVAGADFAGVPMPVIGFNKDLAWSVEAPSTVSYYVLQAMTVESGANPAYVIDGVRKPLEMRPIRIDVRAADGKATEQRRFAIPWTDLGPLYRLPAMPGRPAGWYAVTDAGDGNARGLDQLLAIARTSNMADFAKATADNRGIGTHFIGGDRHGDAIYIESGPLLGVSDEVMSACRLKDAAPTVLDGSRSSCGLRDATGTAVLATPDKLPSIVTRGIVQNTNNSYHRSIYGKPLSGYSSLLGAANSHDPRLPMSNRRMKDIAADGRVTPEEALAVVYDNRNYAAETWLDAILAHCGAGLSARAQQACGTLRSWNRRNDADSRGALLFQELWGRMARMPALFIPSAEPAGRAIAATDAAKAGIATALDQAMDALAKLGLKGDEPWGAMLARATPAGRIPLHGGADDEGVLNSVSGGPLTEKGFSGVNSGTAYLQRVSWDRNGRPIADVVLAHGQSYDPDSPHYGDQIDIFRTKRLVRLPFTETEIRKDPAYRLEPIGADTPVR